MDTTGASPRMRLLLATAAASVPLAACVLAAAWGRNPGPLVIAGALLSPPLVWAAVRTALVDPADIARLRRASQALAESERRFRTLAHTMPVGVFRTDAKGYVTYVNEKMAEIAGRPQAELLGLGMADTPHPDDAARVMADWRRVVADRACFALEYRIARPDGSEVTVLTRSHPELDEDGRVVGQVGTVTDVTPLRAAREALAESEARLRMALKLGRVTVFVQDAKLRYTWMARAHGGVPDEKYVGLTDFHLFPAKEARQQFDLKTLILAEGVGRRCQTTLTVGHEERAFDLCLEPLRDADGAITGLVGAGVEVTEHRQLAEALRRSDQRFRLALKHTGVTVCAQDRDLRYVWIYNPPEGTPEAIVGRTDYELFPSGEAEALVRAKRRVVETGQAERMECALPLDGHRYVFDCWYEPLRDDAGEVVGVIGAAVDVTRDREQRAQLVAARVEAERANEAKSRFLAAASHDLRQPFQAMRLFKAVLMEQLTDPRAVQVAEKLGEAMTAGEELLNALLDISTLEAGIVRPQPVEVDAGQLIDRLAREFAPQAAAKDLRLKAVRCEATISSDPVMLERILRNLLHNAVRYTERGGILLGARRRGLELLIEVWDTGIGIPADKQAAVFEDFFQIGNPGRDRTQGLGLGLSVVSRTAKLLGHRVELRSRPGKGSVFSVAVPLAQLRPDGA